MLELVRMDEERLFPVLLLDLIFGRIDTKVEDVVWAEAGCLEGKYPDQLLAYLLITSPAYFNLKDFKTLSTCTNVTCHRVSSLGLVMWQYPHRLLTSSSLIKSLAS